MKTVIGLVLLSSIVLSSCKKDLEPQESSVAPTESATAQTPGPAAAPTTAAPQQIQQSQQIQQGTTATTQVTQPAAVAKGMNPAHGQPGHRCDIAVGAPLNSAGKASQTSQTGSAQNLKVTPAVMNSDGTVTPGSNTTITTTNNNSSTPALLNAPATAGTNPAHGQPGHRCDIPVGASLSK